MRPVRRLRGGLAHRPQISGTLMITWQVIRRSVNLLEFNMKTFKTPVAIATRSAFTTPPALAADEDDGACGVERKGKVILTFPAN